MNSNIQKIKAYIPAGEASPAAPLGPLLGQYQINISDFVPKFNQLSLEKYEKGVVLAVNVFRNPKDKTYKIIIKGPTVFGLINSVSSLGKWGKECIGIDKLYDVIRIKHKILGLNTPVRSVASAIFGTLISSKISLYRSKKRKWRKQKR